MRVEVISFAADAHLTKMTLGLTSQVISNIQWMVASEARPMVTMGGLWRTIALDGPCSCALACLLSWHWQTNRQADRQTSNRPRRYKETQSKLDLTWPALASLVTGLLSFSEIPREYCSRLLCMYYLNTLYIITSALKHIGVNLRLTIMTNIVSGHLLLL